MKTYDVKHDYLNLHYLEWFITLRFWLDVLNYAPVLNGLL